MNFYSKKPRKVKRYKVAWANSGLHQEFLAHFKFSSPLILSPFFGRLQRIASREQCVRWRNWRRKWKRHSRVNDTSTDNHHIYHRHHLSHWEHNNVVKRRGHTKHNPTMRLRQWRLWSQLPDGEILFWSRANYRVLVSCWLSARREWPKTMSW